MTVREQLRAAYLASGMTMSQIADLAGCHVNTVANTLSKNRDVRAENLFAIATVLKIEALQIPQRR